MQLAVSSRVVQKIWPEGPQNNRKCLFLNQDLDSESLLRQLAGHEGGRRRGLDDRLGSETRRTRSALMS